jgi:mannose-1-phosphate guanylyltransferase
MAGGCGTRFWPVSRTDTPKQFMFVPELGKSLLQDTYERFSEILPKENILIVTVQKYKDAVLEQIPDLQSENLLLEPYGRDTAPCVAYATCKILQRDCNATTIVSPADHIIGEKEKFQNSVLGTLKHVAENDVLMTIGLVPKSPDVNFGYIQVTGGKNPKLEGAIKVKTFTEKQDAELAKVFLQTGEFLWNSGVFIWNARTIIEEMQKHIPEVIDLFKGWENKLGTISEQKFIQAAYGGCTRISLSYGILERTDRAWVWPADFSWNDVGSWESFYDHKSSVKDKDGNIVLGAKYILDEDKDNMIVTTNKGKLIAIRGLENFLVVDTEDALLICPREDKRFKDLISQLAMPEFEKYR